MYKAFSNLEAVPINRANQYRHTVLVEMIQAKTGGSLWSDLKLVSQRHQEYMGARLDFTFFDWHEGFLYSLLSFWNDQRTRRRQSGNLQRRFLHLYCVATQILSSLPLRMEFLRII